MQQFDVEKHVRELDVASAAAGSDIVFSATEGGVTLSVTVATGTNRLIVRRARHSGARDTKESEALETLCRIVQDRPLQEAADHGVIYAIEELLPAANPVQGIRTPRNAGVPFALAERLMRRIHSAVRHDLKIGHRENRWYVRPDADWLGLSETEQAAALKPIIAAFLSEAGFTSDDLWVAQIERGSRVTVAFGDAVRHGVKAKLLMDLEWRLREATGNPLELFMQDKKDANKIRRL